MKDFKELKIWQRSHKLTLSIYKLSKSFPKEEIYGLTSQMLRSAASIPTNIAEGSGRNTDPDLNRFLIIAMGSAAELEYQLILSKDLEYCNLAEFESLTNELIEIRKMLNAFIQKI
jgi:four helix bundle protein